MSMLPKPVLDFSRYMKVSLNRSPKTIDEYELDLALFFRFLAARDAGIDPESEQYQAVDISKIDIPYIREISREDLYEYFVYTAEERGNSPGRRARQLSAIKSFFKYLTVKERMLEVNPANDLDTPKKKSMLPKFLSLEESKDLLDAIANDGETTTKERDFAIIVLFLNSGMRLSELVNINITDIDREMRSLRVMGKGSKERVIYLNDASRDAIAAYLPVRAADPEIVDKNALFLSRLHKRISVKTVQWLVKKYLKEAGLEYKHYSTHKLRHTAATLMYQTGKVDIRVLKDILGHEQLNTTQIYTHVSDVGKQNAFNMNPLSTVKPPSKPKLKKKDE